MERDRSVSASFYRWIRDLHLYFGLFISPYVLIFAVTTIMLNHRWKADVQVEKTSVPVRLEGTGQLEQATSVLRQLSLSGEMHLRRVSDQKRLRVRVEKPGERTIVIVDRTTQIADVERQRRSFASVLYYLHFNPGPHKVRGLNWFFSKLWGWSIDTVVCLLLFITISGVYMWALIKAERKTGLAMLGAGSVSFVLIVSGFF